MRPKHTLNLYGEDHYLHAQVEVEYDLLPRVVEHNKRLYLRDLNSNNSRYTELPTPVVV